MVKANMNYISFDKFWNGAYVQMSSEKDMVKMNLMGAERRTVRVSTAVDAEDLELPEELDVKVAALIYTVTTAITDNWAFWNNSIQFVRALIAKMK